MTDSPSSAKRHLDDHSVFWVNEAIGTGPFRAYGAAIVALSATIGMTEGYDVSAMSLAAPIVAKVWGLGPAQVGQLLSASVLGLVLGSFLLSPLGDRWGRRPAIVIGLAFATVATAAGAVAATRGALVATRLVAGAGLGMALPNTATLAMELVPRRLQSLAVVVVSSGLALGGGIGAAIVGRYVGRYGHPVIFVFGGAVTGVALLLALLLLPESPLLLVRRDARRQLDRLLHSLTGTGVGDRPLGYRTLPRPSSTVAALLEPGRRRATLLLWLVNFAGIGLVYFFLNWTPSLLVARGFESGLAIRAAAIFAISGVAGSLFQLWLMRRLGPVRLLTSAYVITIGASALLAALPAGGVAFFMILTVAAASSVGAQFCLNAVVARHYPASIRATGTAYATGAGRLGAIVAPAAAGLALQTIASPRFALGLAALPAVIALAALLLLGRSGTLAIEDLSID